MRQKRIAILLPDLRGGGAERMRLLLECEFTAKGYDVCFVVMRKSGELLRELKPNVSVIDLHANRLRNLLIPLIRFLRREKPDALLVAMWPLTTFAIWAVKLSRTTTRVVVSDHGILSLSPLAQGILGSTPMRITMRLSYPWADAVVGVSKGVVKDVASLAGLESKKLFTIYNPAARGRVPKVISTAPALKSWLNANQRVITVGSLKAVKDHSTLLDGFSRVVADNSEAKLLILGEGSLRTRLDKQVAELGLVDNVLMPGFVQDPYPYYLAADLFVLSSQNEGFGNVIVEAMECGLPIVSTDCESGPREILKDGRYGKLVPVGDRDALAAAILATVKEMPNPSRQKARASDFSVEKAANEYLKLLDPDGVNTSCAKQTGTVSQ